MRLFRYVCVPFHMKQLTSTGSLPLNFYIGEFYKNVEYSIWLKYDKNDTYVREDKIFMIISLWVFKRYEMV
jgi:hypothetical protein